MVSKDDTITVNTKCSCGHGDGEKSEERIYENVCPNCGREGTLSVQTRTVCITISVGRASQDSGMALLCSAQAALELLTFALLARS